MVVNNKFFDGELPRLREPLEMLDEKIASIETQLNESQDPDKDGLCDKAEYFVGIGFVAMQQYLVDTIIFAGLNKGDAYALGPMHASGETYASIINSCANWWKHEAEWWNQGEVPASGKRSFELVTTVTDSSSYQLSNAMASICGNNKVSLICVLPYLEEWRRKIYEKRKRKAHNKAYSAEAPRARAADLERHINSVNQKQHCSFIDARRSSSPPPRCNPLSNHP
jgi:hypothetical protein